MKAKFYTCDVFTDRQFGGNQLAVFPDASEIPEALLEPITREFNFSETTFVYPPNDPSHTKRVRIFTPGGELPFAGHPTIGTAVTLGVIGAISLTGSETKIVLEELVGPVPVTIRSKNGVPEFAQLTAAKLPEFNDAVPSAEILAEMLTLKRDEIADEKYPIRYVSVGFPFLYIPVKDRETIGRIRINLPVMERLKLKEVFVFTDEPEQNDFHFRARMFAPLIGITEDPATGSAAASFSGYLAAKDERQSGTLKWNIEQGFEMGRPSLLYIEADKKDGAITAVRVGGNAVMVTEGMIDLKIL
ncbi:MAG: PhzF family phenazine biosynthesis protein [Bacteroidota bacterium]